MVWWIQKQDEKRGRGYSGPICNIRWDQCWWLQVWRPCTICIAGGDGQDAFIYLERYLAAAKSLWTAWTKLRHVFRLICTTLILMPIEIYFLSWCEDGYSRLCMQSFSTDAHVTWVMLLVSRTRRGTFDISNCDSPVILDASLRESPRTDKRTMI